LRRKLHNGDVSNEESLKTFTHTQIECGRKVVVLGGNNCGTGNQWIDDTLSHGNFYMQVFPILLVQNASKNNYTINKPFTTAKIRSIVQVPGSQH
jgi:hypothetical protein